MFILDGLDEIWNDVFSDNSMENFVYTLLNQPDVLDLTRPFEKSGPWWMKTWCAACFTT